MFGFLKITFGYEERLIWKITDDRVYIPNDPHSFSNPNFVRTNHIHLEIEVDFARHIIYGFVILSVEKLDINAKILVLDTKKMNIYNVTDDESGNKLHFNYTKNFLKKTGDKLEILLPKSTKASVKIEYSTLPYAGKNVALRWFFPAETVGKVHPLVFSQSQPILARSMFPCQDTPAIKSTYSAKIIAPKEYTILMSAIRDGEDQIVEEKIVAKFSQKIPVQSYLVAIAVGNLKSQRLGN